MRPHILTLATLLAASLSPARAEGTFTLSVFQGFRFLNAQVVTSGTETADLSFTYQTRRIGFIAYLGADKIKFFASAPAPGSISESEMASWKDYEAGPEPGYYVLRARSDRKLYLVRLVEFANQGKAASYWKMRLEWQEFGSGRGTSRSSAAPSRSEAPSQTARASGGSDPIQDAHGRVVAEIQLETPLSMGLSGELKWIAFYEAGTTERVRTDMLVPGGKAALSVPPGRYDLWIEGRNQRKERIRTVDLSGYKPGAVVPVKVRFDGWGNGETPNNADARVAPASRRSDSGRAESSEERIRRAQEEAGKRRH